MTFSKKLTTVTKFSKFVALVLFIALPFVGFQLGTEYQKKISHSVNATHDEDITKAGVLCEQNEGLWDKQYRECTQISREACKSIGGTFSGCVSPCRHDPNYPDVVCTKNCDYYCKL